jgi:K+-transporting ATPase ATPase C chain
MLTQLRPALLMLLLWTLITGVLYPAVVTVLAQLAFPGQANGSLLLRDGRPIGSRFIGQAFDDPRYFWGRPSATAPYPYNAAASSGSNLGPTNPVLIAAVQARIEALKASDPGHDQIVPVDLVTASASGLDPQISPAAALYQAARVARARGLLRTQVEQLIERQVESRFGGVLGEPRVNVLLLNQALDESAP